MGVSPQLASEPAIRGPVPGPGCIGPEITSKDNSSLCKTQWGGGVLVEKRQMGSSQVAASC